MDWEQYRMGEVIECTFTPRETWRGARLRPRASDLRGKRMLLTVAWCMSEDDKYPGEYALQAANDETAEMLREIDTAWVASGDVTPREGLTPRRGIWHHSGEVGKYPRKMRP